MRLFYSLLIIFFLQISALAEESKILTITGDKNYAPYTYLDRNGNPKGFLVDVWNEWAKHSNYQIQFELVDWVESVNRIKAGKTDIHSGAYTPIDNMHRLKPIHNTEVSLFSIKGFKEPILNQKIGVINLPAFYIDFEARQKDPDNYKSTTRDVKKLVEELKAEQVDGIVIDLRNNGGGALIAPLPKSIASLRPLLSAQKM
mgnify:CR=1 FL=1